MTQSLWPGLALALAISVLSGCATPALDRRIAELRAEVTAQQQLNQPLSAPYHAPAGKDVMVETSAAPLLRVLDAFNDLPAGDRLMTLNSYDYSGYIAQSWTSCPWPLDHERIGFKVIPAFKEAFGAIVYVDKIENDWSAGTGLSFRMKRTVGAAAMLISGRIWLCGISGDIPIGAAVIAGGANSAAGRMHLEPKANVGLEYRMTLEQPMYFVAYVVTPVFSAPVPLWFTFDLTKGTIPNPVGLTGEIRVSRIGAKRQYALDIRYDSAEFLAGGLRVAAPVEVSWRTTP